MARIPALFPIRLFALIALLLAVAVAPVVADDVDAEGEAAEPACYATEFDAAGEPAGPEYCTQEVWFHRAESMAGNLGATGGASYPSWDTEPPAQSVTEGAGAGFLTVGPPRQMASNPDTDPYAGATFEGAFTGNIDNMVIDLFMFAPAVAASDTGNFVGSMEMEIDGTLVQWPTQVDLPLEDAGDGVSQATFAIADIHEAMELEGLETGDDVEHEIRFFFSGYGLASGTAIVVFDTTEVPSGIVFNAPDIDGLTTFRP